MLTLSLRAPAVCALALAGSLLAKAAAPALNFEAVTVDARLQIGYGVTTGDVNGDGKLDILLADKSQVVWYENPGWRKHVMAEALTTPLDNVCIAAQDLDQDGKVEVAVGAGWNPNDTVGSGALYYLKPGENRSQRWTPVKLPHEPTIHRIRWVKTGSRSYGLAALPLHGRGNQNGEGAGVRFLMYHPPADANGPWKTSVINDSLHLTHNFDPVKWTRQPEDEILVVSREGIFHLMPGPASQPWPKHEIVSAAANPEFKGAGEVADGRLADGRPFVAAIEPMHGDRLTLYTADDSSPSRSWQRKVLDTGLKEGHAVAAGDLLAGDGEEIVVGWRGANSSGRTGIKIWRQTSGNEWTGAVLDQDLACEDLCLADFDGDGRLDIAAAGRATRNLKVYFNREAKP